MPKHKQIILPSDYVAIYQKITTNKYLQEIKITTQQPTVRMMHQKKNTLL